MTRLDRNKQRVLLVSLAAGMGAFLVLFALGVVDSLLFIVLALGVTATVIACRFALPRAGGTSISETTVTIEYPIERAPALLRSALESVPHSRVTNEAGPLNFGATTSMSAKSHGEVVTIEGTVLSDRPGAAVPIRCQITSQLVDSAALLDYGKNRQNIETVATTLAALSPPSQ